MKDIFISPKARRIGTIAGLFSVLGIAACDSPAGTQTVGRVMSHDVTTKNHTTLRQFPHNPAQFPLVDSERITDYSVTIQDCGTGTPPPTVWGEGCTPITLHGKESYDTYSDEQLVQLNRGRVIGILATGEATLTN